MIKAIILLTILSASSLDPKIEDNKLEQETYSVEALSKYLGRSISFLPKIFPGYAIEHVREPSHEPESYDEVIQVKKGNFKIKIYGKIKIDRIIVGESSFRTRKNVKIGDGYCLVKKLYQNAKSQLNFDDGVYLSLYEKKSNLLLKFPIPDEQTGVILMGSDEEKIKAFCYASLSEITLVN